MLKSENQGVFDIKEMFYLEKVKTDGKLPSPIDLSLKMTTPLRLLEKIEWRNLETLPQKMNLTNSGKTAVVTGQWSADRPTLAGGFLPADYVLSQVHFHWGRSDLEGSEHKIGGTSFPLEMHVMLYRSCYESQRVALACPDGVVVVVYLAHLARRSCPGLQWLSGHLARVAEPYSSVALPLAPFSSLVTPFTEDYLAYWGAISTELCSHPVLWLLCRSPLAVSSENLTVWRTLLDSSRQPMMETCGVTYPAQGRTVFHVNPSGDNFHLIHPYKEDLPGLVGNAYGDDIKTLHLTDSLSDTQIITISDTKREMGTSTGRTSVASVLSISPPLSPRIKEGAQLTSKEKRELMECRNLIEKELMTRMFPKIPVPIDVISDKFEKKASAKEVCGWKIKGTLGRERFEQTVSKNIIQEQMKSKQTMPEVVNEKPVNDEYTTSAPKRTTEQTKNRPDTPKPKLRSRLPVRTPIKFSHIQSSLKPYKLTSSQMNSPMAKLGTTLTRPENIHNSIKVKSTSTSLTSNRRRPINPFPRTKSRPWSTSSSRSAEKNEKLKLH